MHSDSFFAIGRSHTVCQDYAIAGMRADRPFAILSDGCSSSSGTDVGARILSLSFLDRMRARIDDLETVLPQAITTAKNATQLMGLPETCLDATLLSCHLSPIDDPTVVNVMAIGDGVIAARRRDGEIEAICIEYPDGAPEYLSYVLDSHRHHRFNTEFGTAKSIHNQSNKESVTCQDQIFAIQFPIANYDIVAVMSDGVETFEGMTWREVVSALMDFKNTAGHFIERRMKRFIKDCGKQNISHSDDVSMSAIYLG